jgi:hypothetical protein
MVRPIGLGRRFGGAPPGSSARAFEEAGMTNDPSVDRDPAEGGDVGPPAADTAGGEDDLVASEGVNETDAEDSPGASISEPGSDGPDAEPNEPA